MFNPADAMAGLVTRPGAAEMPADDDVRELMMTAINTAKGLGASYSDVRIGRYRNSIVFTREQQIVQTADTDSIGAGIRALVDGTWGFGATKVLTKDGVAAAAREAVAIAKANRIARDQPVQLAPTQAYPNATWKSDYKIDPFTIPIEQRADLLLRANAEALKVKGVRFVNSGLLFVKEDKFHKFHSFFDCAWQDIGIFHTAIEMDMKFAFRIFHPIPSCPPSKGCFIVPFGDF